MKFTYKTMFKHHTGAYKGTYLLFNVHRMCNFILRSYFRLNKRDYVLLQQLTLHVR